MSEATSTMLSEEEVRERLSLCEDNTDVLNELYTFGQTLGKEIVDRIRAVESKATFFAAYGAAIVTFLVSSISIWSKVGNQGPAWISACAGFCGLMCTCFSVRVLWLTKYEWISEDEWLKAECLSTVDSLKQYRILTIWGTIHSHDRIHSEKARELQRAQIWLTGAVVYLFYLLFNIAFMRSFAGMIEGHSWIPLGDNFINFWRWGFLLFILGLTFIFFIRRTWLVRLI